MLFGLLGLVFSLSAQNLDQQINRLERRVEMLNKRKVNLQDSIEGLRLQKLRQDLMAYGLPAYESEPVFHSAMALSYNEEHEQANWVTHIILPEVKELKASRSNDFRADPLVKTGSTVQQDFFLTDTLDDGEVIYDGFGFDRGHLAPSADFRWSQKALSESFLYSNMTPQRAEFNRESWANLEAYLRGYVIRNDVPLYITTGPVLNENLQKVERSINGLSIPEYYFKLAVDLKNRRAIAFLMPNEKLEYPLESYVTTIDSVEQLTGFDFYARLSPDDQQYLEALRDIAPFQPEGFTNDREPIPVAKLPVKNAYNTITARQHVDSGKKITVCGTAVSTTKSAKGNVFLNLDKSFPNQIFSVSIFNSNLVNFSYAPEVELEGKLVCVTGKVSEYQGTPSMIVEHEKAIEVIK